MTSAFQPPTLPVFSRGSVSTAGSPIPGLMQSYDLLISSLLSYAATHHRNREIVSRLPELPLTAPTHRCTYSQLYVRTQQLAHALVRTLGIRMGDVVGVIAWNTYRHVELYYAVSGMGAILHTINPRLFLEQLDYIINHANDQVIFVDYACVPVLTQLVQRNKIKCNRFIVMTDQQHMPPNLTFEALCYEAVIAGQLTQFEWPRFPETAAALLCYTSGTTGNPKGVLFSHRSTILHAHALLTADVLAINTMDTVLCTIPFMHVSGWGWPYACVMAGAKMMLPGATGMDPAIMYQCMKDEDVTICGGVPTLWLALLHYLDEHSEASLPRLQRVVVGGSACPPSMIERFHKRGVRCMHCWGMTEMSPIGTVGSFLSHHQSLSHEQRMAVAVKQGRGLYGVELRTVNDAGETLPRDGTAYGDLQTRGPWVTSGYYKLNKNGGPARTWSEQCNIDDDGWFTTGDVATLDHDGYMQIVDRSKDVIKSGGEWVSSIDLENAAVGHPHIAEAAVIGIQHSKWQERPLLVAVRKKGMQVQEAELLEHMRPKVAKWWLPEAVEFVDELPHTATGKLLKTELRKRYSNYRFPNDTGALSGSGGGSGQAATVGKSKL